MSPKPPNMSPNYQTIHIRKNVKKGLQILLSTGKHTPPRKINLF